MLLLESISKECFFITFRQVVVYYNNDDKRVSATFPKLKFLGELPNLNRQRRWMIVVEVPTFATLAARHGAPKTRSHK